MIEWECINGHKAEQPKGSGPPPLDCLHCGSDEWREVAANE